MRGIPVILVLLLAVAACGDSGDSTTTSIAENCDELAEAGVALLSVTFANTDLAEQDPGLVAEGPGAVNDAIAVILEDFRSVNAELLAQQATLSCANEMIDGYFCANTREIVTRGEVSTQMLTDIIQETC